VPIAAGVVGDACVRTVLAALDVTTESCRAATLDRRHHLQLAKAHMTGVGCAPRRSVAAENIRDLQRRAGHASRVSGGRLVLLQLRGDEIERADDLADRLGGDAGVERRRVEFGVTERPRAIMLISLCH
jgi:hypothetical protein